MKNLILISIIVILASCSKSKDNDEIKVVEGTYLPEAFSTPQTLVLITKNGRTTDKTAIRKFLNYQQYYFNHLNFSNIFPLDEKSQSTTLTVKSVNFHSQNDVTISYSPVTVWQEAKASVIIKDDHDFVVEHTKTDTLVWGSYPGGDFGKYPIRMSNNLASEVMGVLRAVNFSFPIRMADNKLYVPTLNYMLVQGQYNKYVTGSILNFIREDMEKQLGANDTVLAQVRLVQLLKQ